jgi:hypothetical protein
MKRTEFETKLVQLEADYAKEKIAIENLINDIYTEMDEYDQKLIEFKGRARNLRNNIEQIKALYLENKAKLFVEFEESKEEKNESRRLDQGNG